MNVISLQTSRCIVTGEPATIWTGHVIATGYGAIRDDGRMPILKVGILAGFSSHEASKSAPSDALGCYGEWKQEHGLMLDDLWREPTHLERANTGNAVVVDTDLMRGLWEATGK